MPYCLKVWHRLSSSPVYAIGSLTLIDLFLQSLFHRQKASTNPKRHHMEQQNEPPIVKRHVKPWGHPPSVPGPVHRGASPPSWKSPEPTPQIPPAISGRSHRLPESAPQSWDRPGQQTAAMQRKPAGQAWAALQNLPSKASPLGQDTRGAALLTSTFAMDQEWYSYRKEL